MIKHVVNLLKALCVDKRLLILEKLKKAPSTVNDLATALNITASAVSQHLKVLKSAGLVDDIRQGNYIYYTLITEELENARKELNKICSCHCLKNIHKHIREHHQKMHKKK